MSRRSSTNHKDPAEGIRQALGKHVKILLKTNVRLEKGGGSDKSDPRILVFSPHRLFVMTAKVPTKIDHHFHYLDIQSIESKKHNQVVFRINDRNYSFRPGVETQTSDLIDAMIITVARAIRSIFPGVMLSHVIPKVEVVPVKRIQSVLEMKPLDFKDMGPCGGFSTQYACYCDYYNMPYREEVAWDVDTIYFSHDSHELCLTDFEHLDQRDLICIISALEHNTWFTKLRASANTAKLASEVLDKILSVVSKSMSLQEIHLSSAGVRWEFFQRLAQSMSTNQYCNLTTLDISLNFVEDRGITSIAQVFSHFPRGTRHINLAHCTLTGKGINSLAQALVTNKLSLNSLTYLNLAGNSLKEEVQNLVSFLAQPNVVSILDLSSTEVPSEILFSALVRGCTQHLSHLNLARNPFTARKSKGDIPSSFKQFFATTLGLRYLNMSHCKLPLEALKSLLLGLACNQATSDVELNISANNLGAGGAVVMENALPGVTCVSRLDVSDNALDVELASVVHGVSRNKGLLSLNISRNLPKIKARDVVHVMEAIVQLIQEEETSLQKLNLSDCKLKTDINNVINALGSNQCLQVLDISGNGMGDVGARLLAKALQINTRLRTIHLDRNNISLQGYQDITYALQSNFSMRHIPFPTYDMQPAMKTSPDRVDSIIRRMQENLQRNSNPRTGKNSTFRLTQGFLLSSTQQVLDKWCAQVQDTVHTINRDTNEPSLETQQADGFIKDAEKCKLLLSSLHETTAKRDQDSCPITKKLAQISSDLETFLTDHIATSVTNMLATAQELCPNVLQLDSKSLQDLQHLTETKSRIPPEFVKNLVNDTIGVEVQNKVNEMNLVLANHISDKVIDDVIDNLARCYKSLVGDLGSIKKKRSLTPDVLKGSSQRLDSQSESGDGLSLAGDTYSQKSSPSPLSTPHLSKRKSLHDRKLRPKSVVDNVADDYAPDLLTNMSRAELDQSIEEQDSVPELPEIPQLQHLAKNRPKRNKKHASSKTVLKAEAGDSEDHKEGLDTFFSRSLSPPNMGAVDSPVGSPQFEETHNRHVNLVSRSREDLRSKVGGKVSPLMFDPLGRKSPASDTSVPTPSSDPMTTSASGKSFKQSLRSEEDGRVEPQQNKEQRQELQQIKEPVPNPKVADMRGRGGLSCLKPSTLDEDMEPLSKSPEKKPAMSPSGRSISDIFGKVAQDKLKSKTAPAPSGTSPFTTRKSESETVSSKRRSFFTSDSTASSVTESVASPEGEEGEDGVVKRNKQGLGGDLLAEMKVKQEKRASVVPKPSSSIDPGVDKSEGREAEENPFGGIKLRSTGRASNLTSPTSDFSPADNPAKSFQSTSSNSSDQAESSAATETNVAEKIKHSSSSIIGLRAATFDTSSKSRQDLLNAAELEESRPRPPPKPRPWSIVGVDRKSGEFTQVDGGSVGVVGGNVTPPSPVREDSSGEEEGKELMDKRRGSLANRGSVRDMIANLNKPEKEGLGSVGGLLSAGSVRDRVASMNKPGGSESNEGAAKKKGNSLPRSNDGLTGPSSSAKSPGIKAKNSPKNFRKESTTDDPRILKLDDEFMYEDTVNV